MRAIDQFHRRWALLLVVALLLPVLAPVSSQPLVAAPKDMGSAGGHGIVCTTSMTGSFTLTATEGQIQVPDGNTLYMWGFANGNGAFQYPGPILCVDQGTTVSITLNNSLWEPVSLVFPGQEAVLANGLPSEPVFDAGGKLVSLAPAAAANGGSMTYSFVAAQPGTYTYQSGSDPTKQVQMGLFGVIVVYPPQGLGGEHYAYNWPRSQYRPDYEFIQILSEVDPDLHTAVERRQPFNMKNYVARYFLINGRGLPDTLADNFAPWLPAQPYGAMSHIHPYDATMNPLPALVRYVSFGNDVYPFHPHGKHAIVIGRDGRPLMGPGGEDATVEMFSLPIMPGQTWDTTFQWRDAEQYDKLTNPIPYPIPPEQDMAFGMYYSGSPYLGDKTPLPPGTASMNMCGEYYVIAHNHNLTQIMAWDLVMGGMGTFVRVDPLNNPNCGM